MVEVKQKETKYKLIVRTGEDSVELKIELKATIVINQQEITYTDSQSKFIGYVQNFVRTDVYEQALSTKKAVEDELNEKLTVYVNGLNTIEKLAQEIGAEIEVE